MAPTDEDLAGAKLHLLELVNSELAVTPAEIEAKLTEEGKPREQAHFPHVLTLARQELVLEGRITATEGTGKGGNKLTTFSPTDAAGRTTAIRRAAARKRLLTARYLGWAESGSTYKHGIIGPTGEAVVRQAIMESARLSVTETNAGEVTKALGVKLRGPLDSGGWLPILNDNGLPAGLAYVPIEVKNIRGWLYPQNSEVFQLLSKAAVLQRAAPDTLIHPILICRRVHYTIFFMAKQLGFKVRDTRQQYIRTVNDDALAEVRTELGFTDLMKVPKGETTPNLRRFFRRTIEDNALDFTTTWRATVLDHDLDRHFEILRDDTLRYADRADAMRDLRIDVAHLGLQGGW
ncbi:hypothetical protein ACIA5E_19045 [Nocardia asteroides]|uniref:hypothetical protein n=1 Tax=Nocardia asteroides TaxID=1824 RepID=UPI00379816B4